MRFTSYASVGSGTLSWLTLYAATQLKPDVGGAPRSDHTCAAILN